MKTVKPRRVSEKEVGLLCDNLATQMGYRVERYEQQRASRITEGLPDRRLVHPERGWRLWVEYKAKDGKLTRDQHEWLKAEARAGAWVACVCSVEELAVVLNIARNHDIHPATRGSQLYELLEDFAARGYRRVPPKRPRRPRLPR